jgi:hypothetical protein
VKLVTAVWVPVYMRQKGTELWTKFVFIIKFEGLNPFYSVLPLLKVSRYISYRGYGIVTYRIG